MLPGGGAPLVGDLAVVEPVRAVLKVLRHPGGRHLPPHQAIHPSTAAGREGSQVEPFSFIPRLTITICYLYGFLRLLHVLATATFVALFPGSAFLLCVKKTGQ